MVAACLVMACAVPVLVSCGLDRRPIVIGSGVVTAGSSQSGQATPGVETATPSVAGSSDSTTSPTTEESNGTASPTADESRDSTASPTADETSDPPAACGPIPGQSGGGALAVPTPFRDDEAELDADGQTGDGQTVAVAEVQLSKTDGFVAVCTLDDRLLLGSLPIARSNDERSVHVTLDEPITSTIEILVVLYADNGDGHLDWTTDPRVSGDDDDITDLEVERLLYRYVD